MEWGPVELGLPVLRRRRRSVLLRQEVVLWATVAGLRVGILGAFAQHLAGAR